MVLFQRRKSCVKLKDDVENVASFSDKDWYTFNGCYSRSVISEVPTLNPKGSYRLKIRSISITASMCLVIAGLGYIYLSNIKTVGDARSAILTLNAKIEEIRIAHDKIDDQVFVAWGKFKSLQEEEAQNIKLKAILEMGGMIEHTIDNYQKHIQNFHRSGLVKRFGQGPYYIEVEILLKGISRFFTLQTVATDIMHHTVYVFMDMVDRKVWDNSTFVHNQDHVLDISPISLGEKTLEVRKLAFLEHSEEHLHEQNTLAFSGIGPEMYLNLKNNSEIHGPGGDGNPCFAKVVIGLSTMSSLKATSAEIRNDDIKTSTTLIKSMKIVEISDKRLIQYGIVKHTRSLRKN